MKKTIRIVLVDDHLVVRMGLAAMLSLEENFEIVGQADSGAEARVLADSVSPDVIVMDLMMPDMDGAEATRHILAAHPNMKILVLTSFGTSPEIQRALESGAAGALAKTSTQDEICAAIRAVAAGEQAIGAEIKNTLKCLVEDAAISPRQRQILELVANGYATADVGRILGISANCVKYHLKLIFANLGASTRAEAISIALSRGIIRTGNGVYPNG